MSLLNDASLVFIPSGYKEDKVYSIIPSNGAGDLDFVRGCDATRINPQSLVEGTPWNILSNSEQFSNANGWFANTTGGSTAVFTANYGVAPNGTTTADRIQLNLNSGPYADWVNVPTLPIIVGQTYTYSIWLKSLIGNTNLIFFGIGGGIGNRFATISNEWVRYSTTFTALSTDVYPRFLIEGSTSSSADILAWGYQLNIGSTAKPYFPTTDRLNVPRLTYSPTLIERQSTNFVLYSQEFNNGYWLGAPTKTANTTTAPDGTITADTLGEVASNVTQNAASGLISFVSGTSYTMSIYAKNTASGRGFIQLAGYGLGVSFANVYANFNLNNGTTSNVTGGTATITDVSNGWYRCSFTFTSQATTSERYNANLISSASAISFEQYTGDTSKSIYIWGAQLETGALSSYIPTTSTAVTRTATYNSGCPSLLLEKQSTNLALWSEQFDNSAWNSLGGSITANYGISPDGTQNADRFQGSASARQGNYQSIAVSNGVTYTLSMYVKSLSGTQKIRIGADNGCANPQGAQTFTFGETWTRITTTFASTETNWNIYFDNTESGIACGGTTLPIDCLIWGAQLEASSYPTSYIKTTSATATRLADSCSKTGISSLIGQTEGTMFIEVPDIAKRDNGRYLFLSDGSYSNRIVIYHYSGNLNVYCSAGAAFNLTYSLPSGRSKIAFGYKSGLYSLFVNGVERATNTLSAVPSNLSAFGIGSSEGSIGTPDPLDSSVSQALLFKRRLTNTELEKLTTL